MFKYIFLIMIFSILLTRPVFAQMGMMGRSGNAIATSSADQQEVNLDQATAEILEFQGVGSVNEVDCGKISDDQFEKLGDVWMETMHPGKSHEYMERMMARLPLPSQSDSGQGGEGSASLRSAHITMGQRNLGCRNDLRGRGWHTSMMGMMGGWGGYGGSMTGLWFLWLVSWVLVNVLLIALIRYFWKKGSNHKS